MSMHPPFEIPCPHARKGANPNQMYTDHHPLTMEELRKILKYAVDNHNNIARAKAQMRLTQAIKGMLCPRPERGTIAEVSDRLENIYVDWLRSEKPVNEVIDRIAELIVISN